MVKLTRIYTRGGDKGQTSLGRGERVAKHDLRVEAYGTVDETNAAIGVVRLHLAGAPELDRTLQRLEEDGVVQIDHRLITIENLESLRECASGLPSAVQLPL